MLRSHRCNRESSSRNGFFTGNFLATLTTEESHEYTLLKIEL